MEMYEDIKHPENVSTSRLREIHEDILTYGNQI